MPQLFRPTPFNLYYFTVRYTVTEVAIGFDTIVRWKSRLIDRIARLAGSY